MPPSGDQKGCKGVQNAVKTIHLIRHGESAANAGLPTSDPGLIPLTARGHEQAVRLSELWPSTPSAIVTSQYQRAMDTAQPLCTRFELSPTTNPLLHEFLMLDPEQVVGTTVHERRPMVDDYWTRSDPTCRMGDGAEAFKEFAARVDGYLPFLDALPHEAVVVGHGMWFAMLVWRVMKFPVDDHAAMKSFRAFQIGLPMPNCGVYELQGSGAAAWRVAFNAKISRQMPIVGDPGLTIQ